MAEGGENENLVLVTTEISGVRYSALMSKELADLYRSPQCDPATRCALTDAIRAQNTSGKSEAACSNETPLANDSCNFLSTQSSTPESASSSEQSIHIWTEAEEKQLIECRLSKESDFSGKKAHDTLWEAISKELNGEGLKVRKQQIMNKWKSLKKKYKEVNDHNSKTGSDRIDWKHKEAFDRAYGNKASTKLSASFDTGRKIEVNKCETLKRKVAEGNADREGIVETTADLPKKKMKPNLKSDLVEKLDSQNSQLMEQMELQHKEKLERMDRMLDLFERSLDKK